MDEKQVIFQICAGDVDGYTQLVDRYQVGLIIYCERMVGDRMEAEDIAQKSFIKAYQKIATFDPNKARFSTWLYRIAANEALDFLRKTKRLRVTDDIEAIEPIMPDVLSEELMREVREAVLALMPPEQRRVIEAYYWEGKSGQAIADEMGVPINTVKSWLRRAKVQLRKALS
jgi:RNA polymerase sigma-70 factor, ECF subfamily